MRHNREVSSRHPATVRSDAVARRLFDVGAAGVGLAVLAPVLLITAAAIKLHDGGRVFYRAQRVGKGGELFELYKFRTMVHEADRQGPGITSSGDSRITPVGRVLRRTKLDELPQLINVLRGDMTLVGPRPEDPRYVALYTPTQRQILEVRPGITSAASLAYRHEEQMLSGPDWEEVYRRRVMPEKLSIDLEYISRRTFWSDVMLIVRTIRAMFF